MKKIIVSIVSMLLISPLIFAQTKAGRVDNTYHTTFYTCPVHTMSIHQEGYCPICGMKLNLSAKENMKATVMNNYACPVSLGVTTHDPANCPKCGPKSNLSVKEQMKAEVMRIYTCPMHPNVALDKNGICRKCA